MKPSSYIRAQNFAAPSIIDNKQRTYDEISSGRNTNKKSSSHQSSSYYSTFSSFSNKNKMIRSNNIMFDSRVCRGNTYAKPVLTEDQRRNRSVYERLQGVRRMSIEKRKLEKVKKPGTPPPVEGRTHVMVQTDGTLEEIFGSSHIEISHNGGKDYRYCNMDETERSCNKENEIVSIEEKHISSYEGDDKKATLLKNEELLTENIARLIYEEAESDALSKIGQDHSSYEGDDKKTTLLKNEELLTENIARLIYEEAESDALSKIGQDHSSYEGDYEKTTLLKNEELLTENIARLIYEEAESDALSKIGQDYMYFSDPG